MGLLHQGWMDLHSTSLGNFGPIQAPAVNNSKSKGKLTITLRTAIFKLLRKGEKDPTLATNFRPKSLLPGFYKLASCVITNCIKKVIPQLIGKQQKAYVPNDNIGPVLINLLSTMQNYNDNKIAGLILAIDFRKAFDSINHDYIQVA